MLDTVAIIGAGRVGSAIASALSGAGVNVTGPLGRHDAIPDARIVLLCVPDREIANASARVTKGAIVGHVSASAPLELLDPHERFILHPLLSITGGATDAPFAGATCAIDANGERSLEVVLKMASMLRMRPRTIPTDSRALYHAAASMAANYVTAVLGVAEELAAEVGLTREALRPLVQSAVDRWLEHGAGKSLTGPIARGDEATVSMQRIAVAEFAPHVLPVWKALEDETRRLAGRRE